MRAFSAVMALVFGVSAFVQWNDPDPWSWIAGYGAAAGLSALAAFGRRLFLLNAVAAMAFLAAFLVWAGSLPGADPAAFASFAMQAPSHEEPREAVGLALGAIWCGALSFWSRLSAPQEGASEP